MKIKNHTMRNLFMVSVLFVSIENHAGVFENKSDKHKSSTSIRLLDTIVNYGYALFWDIVDHLSSVFTTDQDNNGLETVIVQAVAEDVHGNNYYCTENKEDCQFNEQFFNDTWYTGKINKDSTKFIDVDTDPMTLVFKEKETEEKSIEKSQE